MDCIIKRKESVEYIKCLIYIYLRRFL